MGMINLGGIVILLLLVFGIYILSGGSMDIVLHALPAEGGTIGGAAAATVIIGNSIGVVKTMASIDQPPAILGGMIGGALVGTFLGVLLAYGIVGPLGHRVTQIRESEAKFYEIIRTAIVSYLHGHPPAVSVELGRQQVESEHQPTFAALDEACQALKPV